MLRSRESKLGLRGAGVDIKVARVGGVFKGGEGEEGIWWRKEVRRWELWIWMGSSRRMSW